MTFMVKIHLLWRKSNLRPLVVRRPQLWKLSQRTRKMVFATITASADKTPASPAKSTSSITSNLRRTQLDDPLQEEDIELSDLDEEVEAKIGEESMNPDENEDNKDENGEPPKKKTTR